MLESKKNRMRRPKKRRMKSMKKRNVKQTALEFACKMVEREIKMSLTGWPPACIAFLYQPKRPKNKQVK